MPIFRGMSLYSKVLFPPRLRGRPKDMGKLLTFLNESQHPDCIGRKTTCETLTLWINELREVGIKENERLIGDSESGRSSVTEVQPEYIKVWADLMQLHDDGKKEAVKITRYNRVPDHLVGKVQLAMNLIYHTPATTPLFASPSHSQTRQSSTESTPSQARSQSDRGSGLA